MHRPNKRISKNIPSYYPLRACCPSCKTSVPFMLSEDKILELGFEPIEPIESFDGNISMPESGVFQPKRYGHYEWSKQKRYGYVDERGPSKEDWFR